MTLRLRSGQARAGTAIVLVVVLGAIFAPWLLPWDASSQDLAHRLSGPSWQHWFGLDELGRDILARVVMGARVSLLVGFVVVGVSSAVGLAVGAVSGYYGGWIDQAIGRVMDVLMAFPGMLLAIALVAVLGPSLTNVVLALAVIGWVGYARLVRGQVLRAREFDYVVAARALGSGTLRILTLHVLPTAIPPVLVQATLGMAGAILSEAALSFLGLGIANANHPSWGALLQDTRAFWQQAWWTAFMPGLAISVAVLSFNLFGDALRDVLDPRLRQ